MSEPPGALSCPRPMHNSRILMAHGGGGRMMHDLIGTVFSQLCTGTAIRHDGAVVECAARRLAVTTDTYVVDPIFFPGGDIGRLAVCGTINDLAMCGARPAVLTAGFVIEEGLSLETLEKVVRSMRVTADEAQVSIVTGDTKVLERARGDGLYINTTGIGWLDPYVQISPAQLCPSDAIILSGDLGRHGIALMAVREGLEFDAAIMSDCAPLWEPVASLLDAGISIHCLRDLTRGGLASALVEIAEASRHRLQIDEPKIPVCDSVAGACEILGLDPLHVANEGRFCAFVPADQAARTVNTLRRHSVTQDACIIGHVRGEEDSLVWISTAIGTTRVLQMPAGDQLPRIC